MSGPNRHIGKLRPFRFFPGGNAHLWSGGEGDFFMNRDTGTTYRVLAVKPAPRTVGCWNARVERIDDWAVEPDAEGVWCYTSIRRGESLPPISHEAAQAWPPDPAEELIWRDSTTDEALT